MYQAACRNCYHKIHKDVIEPQKQELGRSDSANSSRQAQCQMESPTKPLQDVNNTSSPVF